VWDDHVGCYHDEGIKYKSEFRARVESPQTRKWKHLKREGGHLIRAQKLSNICQFKRTPLEKRDLRPSKRTHWKPPIELEIDQAARDRAKRVELANDYER
jgi:hypothetical protein